MLFQQILLNIVATFHEERTISAAFHLLRGKRSGQTIQDVGIFKLHALFGLMPKLARQKFDAEVELLVAKSYLTIGENGYYQLLEAGKKQAAEPIPVRFDGWYYRGNEHVFFSRLSLIVQSLSHQGAQVRAFSPIEKNEGIQRWVREFLHRNKYQDGALQATFLQEMNDSLTGATLDDFQRECVIYRLTGYEMPGATWQQLAFQKGVSEMDVQLFYISALHCWLQEIYSNVERYPHLIQLTQQIRIETPLTDSTTHTARLYRQGHSMEQISQIRRLKTSTIEDHFVELVMNDRQFDIAPFVTALEQQQVFDVIETYDTRKLKVLREILPHLSYFQLRIVLARGQDT